MQAVKRYYKYILTFCIAAMLLMGLLVAAAMIPRSAIKENVRESATYLCEGKLFGTVIKDAEGSKIDRYADSILLAIAYQYDSKKPLSSVMWSSYYYTDYQNENKNLLDAVTNDYGANQQYLRYWHGSNAIVRPLLVAFNLKQIYILNGILMGVLVILLMTVFIRQRAYPPAIGVFAGLVMTAFWFVPMSLEYTWTFLLMLIVSIAGAHLAFKGKYGHMGILFLLSGMVTNYLDFLTTETLTLTVPLLLILWIKQRQSCNDSFKSLFKLLLKNTAAWAFGYVGMWLLKWLIASIVLGENVMPYVSSHIGERLGGDLGIEPGKYIFGALSKNLGCLFPFGYGTIGTFTGIALIMLAVYTGYVYHVDNIDKKSIILYVLPGLIPYIRYAVLHNHSYLHCFFTYRAQLATVLAIVLILEKLTDGRWPINANGRKRKS